MDDIFILLFLVLFVCLILSGYYIYTLRKSFDEKTDEKLREIVKEINNSNRYAYTFDKTQETNLKNLESNVKSLYNSMLLMKDNISKGKRTNMQIFNECFISFDVVFNFVLADIVTFDFRYIVFHK